MYKEKAFHGITVFKESLYNTENFYDKVLLEEIQTNMSDASSIFFSNDDKLYGDFKDPLNIDDVEFIDNITKSYNSKFINDDMDIVMVHQELNENVSIISVIDFGMKEHFACKVYKKNNTLLAENSNMVCVLSESLSSVKNKVKRTFRKFDTKFDNWYANYKEEKKKEERDRLMRTMPKPSKILKNGLAIGGLFILNPILGLTATMVKLATSKKATVKAKHEALREIRAELEIIEEEIKDAEAEGDKDKKKQLLRARRKLNDAITKIKLGDAVTNI